MDSTATAAVTSKAVCVRGVRQLACPPVVRRFCSGAYQKPVSGDTFHKDGAPVVCADFGFPGAGLGPGGGSVREGGAWILIVLLLVESTVREDYNMHDF